MLGLVPGSLDSVLRRSSALCRLAVRQHQAPALRHLWPELPADSPPSPGQVEDEAPLFLCCPITFELFEDPVITVYGYVPSKWLLLP